MKIKIKTLPKVGPLMFIGITGMIVMGCQSAEIKSVSSNEAPMIVSAELFPAELKQGHSVVAQAYGKDPENDAITFRYEWFVNEKSVHHERELPPHFLKRGAKVAVEIIPNDGYNDGLPFKTALSVVKNTPPEIVSIQLLPQPFQAGQVIRAEVTGIDNEGDSIEYDYEWRKNGLPLFSDHGSEIVINDLKKEDLITVQVTPHDGIEAGRAFESLQSKSKNRGPSIISSPPLQFEDGTYTYAVVATDPDGDHLEYSILDPQPGMHFHPKTGHFQWLIPEETKGVQYVTLVVRDSEGEGSAQKVRLDIDFLRSHS